MDLTIKLARVQLVALNRTLISGDGILTDDIRVSLSENARASSCSVKILDKGFRIAREFWRMSIESKGIQVPPELLEASAAGGVAAAAGGTPPNVALPAGTGGPPITTRPTGTNLEAQRTTYQQQLDTAQITRLQEEIKRAAGAAITNRARYEAVAKQIGCPWYFIATIHYREATANFGKHLHNGDPLTGKTFHVPAGRPPGPAPYTWEYSALDALKLKDFHKKTDWSLAAQCWYHEVYNGLGYLNKGRVSPYIWSGAQHYTSGKYVADGRYNASVVDQQVGVMPLTLAILKSAGDSPAPAMAPVAPAATATALTTTPLPVESSGKGGEIIVELMVGWRGYDKLIAFHFIHFATKPSMDLGTQTLTIEGKSVRAILSRVKQTNAYENTSLKQFASSAAKGFGLGIQMDGDLNFAFLPQNAESVMQVMLREASRMGLRVADHPRKPDVIVEPTARPRFSDLLIDEDYFIKCDWADEARGQNAAAPGTTTSNPAGGSSEAAKTEIDSKTGQTNQLKEETTVGTPNPPGLGGVTGAAKQPAGGVVKEAAPGTSADLATAITGSGAANISAAAIDPPKTPNGTTTAPPADKVVDPVQTKKSTQTKPDGTTIETEIKTEKVWEKGKITETVTTTSVTKKGNSSQTYIKQVKTIKTLEGTETITVEGKQGTPNPQTKREKSDKVDREVKTSIELFKPGGATATSSAEAPKQQPAYITLAEGGKVEATTVADGEKIIRGYEGTLTVKSDERMYMLIPSEIIALSRRLVPEEFATEYRVGDVEHSFAAGTSTLKIYVPQGVVSTTPTQMASPGSPASAEPAIATPPLNAGGFIFPVPKGATTIGDGYGTRRGRAPGYRHTILDITAPQGTPAVAMADGVISAIAPNAGGAGNLMRIKHGGGYEATYMHGMPGFVIGNLKVGSAVKQGQAIFKIGTTGGSSGPHLHLSFKLNGAACLLSKVGINVLKMGLPVHRYYPTCTGY